MVSKEQKDRFKRQAEAIAKRLNTNLRYDETALPPPHIVEFTGSPSSGKTTTIKQVYTFLRRHGFEVLMPQEGAEVIPARLRKSPEYNMQTGLYALRILLSETANHAYDFILFDPFFKRNIPAVFFEDLKEVLRVVRNGVVKVKADF